MGVKGLWRLLLPIGRRISIETLEGKILAIDASIWLTQFLKVHAKGLQEERGGGDNDGDAAAAVAAVSIHLIGFFRRICRLLFHGIRPVFVFDGVMPEIKRREILARQRRRQQQFSRQSEASVQRMAKKLLTEQLCLQQQEREKKKTKSNGGGAFADHFHLPDDEAPAGSEAPAASASPSTQEEASQTRDTSTATAADTIDLTSPEYDDINDNANEQKQGKSDWDRPVEDEDGEDLDNDAVAEDAVAWQEINHNNNIDEDNLLSVDYISSLQPSQRKDAIEHAKRRLRLQSRREFMPAAANAQAFSQVQLSNFLKSSQFNLAILSEATKAVQRDNKRGGGGGVTASQSNNTRIELIREDENGNEIITEATSRRTPVVRRPWTTAAAAAATTTTTTTSPGAAVRQRGLSKKQRNRGDDSEEEGENLWGNDNDSNNLHVAHTRRKGKGLVIVDDDVVDDDKKASSSPSRRVVVVIDDESSSSDDEDDGGGDSGGGFVVQQTATTTTRGSASDGNNSGGGFLKQAPGTEQDKEEEEGDDDDGGGGGGGGFFTSKNSPPTRNGVASSSKIVLGGSSRSSMGIINPYTKNSSTRDSNNSKSTAKALPKPTPLTTGRQPSDVACAQELEDRLLAQALQEEEEDANAARAASVLNTAAVSAAAAAAVDGEVEAEENEVSGRKRSWMDADRVLAQALQKVEDNASTAILRDYNTGSGHYSGDDASIQENDTKNSPRPDVDSSSSHRVKEVGDDHDASSSDEDEEDVDWEDGEKDDAPLDVGLLSSSSGQHRPQTGAASGAKRNDTMVENRWAQGSDREEDEPLDVEELSQELDHESRAMDTGLEYCDNAFDDTIPHAGSALLPGGDYSDETAAVLERAQDTATRLADWAGRAFRRVMKEVNQDATISLQKQVPVVQTLEMLVETRTNAETPAEGDGKPAARAIPSRNDSTATGLLDEVIHVPRLPLEPLGSVQALDASTALNALEEDRGTASLAQVRNHRDRDADAVTDEIMEDVKQLLHLFGVPYVDAPAEAEAQCAELEKQGLVHGIVTEDSDVWVFGAQNVYRNIFEEQKYAEIYTMKDAKKELSLGTNEMVALAMLLGGDYTEGVKGVGIVNAMEILQAFDMSEGAKNGLTQFRRWLDGIDILDEKSEFPEEVIKFHEKHRSARTSWTTPVGFPADNVLHAYQNPVVDKSSEAFTWGTPDTERLVQFCNKIGWGPEETRRYLDPVMEKTRSGFRQTRIDSFMNYDDSIKFADVRSKRLREVLKLSPHGATPKGQKKAPREKKRRRKKS